MGALYTILTLCNDDLLEGGSQMMMKEQTVLVGRPKLTGRIILTYDSDSKWKVKVVGHN